MTTSGLIAVRVHSGSESALPDRGRMYVQTCLKGIRGESVPGAGDGLTWTSARDLITSGTGIVSRWWQNMGTITPGQSASVLTEANLDRHLNEYATFGSDTPFVSLAAGYVGRGADANTAYSAMDTALRFATRNWRRPGAVFFCWTPVGFERTVEVSMVSEAIRDTLTYRSWFRHVHQGEVTAKIAIPSNQISRVEWWDATVSTTACADSFDNPMAVDPRRLTDYREWF